MVGVSEPGDAIEAIFTRVAAVATDVRRALAERRAVHGEENPSGEIQLAADVYADEQLEAELLAIDGVASYASEERADVVWASGEQDHAEGDEPAGVEDAAEPALHVACDPLDGSSNLASNNGMGTIVGIYDEPLPAPGDALVAAGYVCYGPITTMVVARDHVTEYLLEDGVRDVLHEDVTLPADPVVYGFGGRVPDWPEDFRAFVDGVETDRLKLRYGGAMVADVNQVLTYGGIFGYPMLTDAPEGKLRLQFEGHPMAHVIATAGGASTDGTRSLLSKTPGKLHERSPVFLGNEHLVDRLEAVLA
ncbi:MAG: class 1 fructose-bisphosphatase [Haloarculaceae archaeon]